LRYSPASVPCNFYGCLRRFARLLMLNESQRVITTIHLLFTYLIRSSYSIQCRVFFYFDNFTDGMTLRTSGQPVARPLSKHKTTQTQNKYIHIPNIHALCGIRTHDPGFRASEEKTCLRPLGYRGRINISMTI
jgi:hypothetical protein